MKRVALAVAALCLAFPAAASAETMIIMAPPPYQVTLDTGSYDSIHTVAVLSGIGANMDLVNSNSFFPKERAVDISNWQINAIIESELRKYLGGRFKFVTPSYDLAQMTAVGSQTWSAHRFQEFVKTVPNDGVDAFIVFRPNTQGRIGLERRYQANLLEVFYEMQIVDAHSYNIIARADGQIKGNLALDVVDDSYALDTKLNLSDERIATLKPQVIKLLKQSLVDTIRALNFNVTLPSAGDSTILEPIGPEIAAPAAK